ncbi:hypothetical protein TWF730_001666 [Orbilia blumenaviensis]|uniref:NACHT domain-containing protein n=1 Tax=Orbilia blumenaviensis TaxID=1796055 RepID=A0AAV9ULR7_9PEZI
MSKRKRYTTCTDDEEDNRSTAHRSSAASSSQRVYTIGWICALPIEMAAARLMLDDIHPDYIPNGPEDDNAYIFGEIGGHYIVIACLPKGIGGGVPTKHDIRLGDVVVGIPTGKFPGVVQYDRGKSIAGDRFEQTGVLYRPHRELLNAVSKLHAFHLCEDSRILALVAEAMEKRPATRTRFSRPGQEDILFQAEYDHLSGVTCERCDREKVVIRANRQSCSPEIHYGLIASGNRVMKYGVARDLLAEKMDIYCFEMEAAGLADVVECLVIRGICDYCDSHKNKDWQGYAAATAAAYAKELLLNIPTPTTKSTYPGRCGLEGSAHSPDSIEFSEDYKKRVLRSLSFPQMDSRRNNISPAHQNTCEWIIKTPEFQYWSYQDAVKTEVFNGVLWIKGKPGVGKSTLMKHILSSCARTFPKHTVAAYFFNARGTTLEKSRLGMLRSLLYQLLDSDPKAYDRFVPYFVDKEKKHGRSLEWCEGGLESILMDLIPSFGQPVVFLVDALDECDESEVRKVISFFELLSSKATSASENLQLLRICLSSRHYPAIIMVKRLDLIVEKRYEHDKDIATYVRDKLRLKRLDQDMEFEIRQKSGGVFLWVVFVVDMLNRALDEGDVQAARNTLHEVPNDLEDIFHTLLNKDRNKSRAILMLLLVLFAKEQLSPEEFYYAVLSGSEPKSLGPRESSIITDRIIKRYITSSSRGLIEMTSSYKCHVQFIHETVNDFLVRNARLQKLDPTLEPDVVSAGHERVALCCLEYLKMYAGYTPAGSLTVLGGAVGEQSDQKFPFLKYSAFCLFYHAERAPQPAQEAFIKYLQECPRIIKILNVMYTMGSRRIAYSRIMEDTKCTEMGLLCILSLWRCPRLIRVLLRGPDIDIDSGGGWYNTALAAAAMTTTYWEDETNEVIQLLISAGAEVNAQGGFFGNALQAAIAMSGLRSYNGNMKSGSNQILYVVQTLLGYGADVNAQGGFFGNALQAAAVAAGGRKYSLGIKAKVIQLLLDAGADVNAQGGYFGNALQGAAATAGLWGSEMAQIIQMLLGAGANVNTDGGEYGNALQAAAANWVCEGAEDDLFDLADPVHATRDDYGAGLWRSTGSRGVKQYYNLLRDMACVLIDNIYFRFRTIKDLVSGISGSDGPSKMDHRVDSKTVEGVVRIILSAGADVHAKGGCYGSALQAAVIGAAAGNFLEDSDNTVVIRALLDAGADVNEQCGPYGNALQAAICTDVRLPFMYLFDNRLRVARLEYKITHSVVSTLLKYGADVNGPGGHYKNAVDAALRTGCQRLEQNPTDPTHVFELLNLLHDFGAADAAQAIDELTEYASMAGLSAQDASSPGLLSDDSDIYCPEDLDELVYTDQNIDYDSDLESWWL